MNKMPNLILSENINRIYERSKRFEYRHCDMPEKNPITHERTPSISSNLSDQNLIVQKDTNCGNYLDPETRKIINLIIQARANIKKNSVKITVALCIATVAIVLIIISWMVHDT